MHVLRGGGQYLAGRELWGWTGVAGLGLAAVSVPFLVRDVVTRIVVLVALALAGREMLAWLLRARRGRLGEEAVTTQLRSLPDDYYLVNDITLGRRGNVDHVLIGPCGVVVIETKRIGGRIRCEGDDWYVNGFRRRSISRQANAAAVAVKETLRRWYPDQATAGLRFVEAVIVFTHPLCRLEVSRPRARVLRYSELLEVVHELAQERRLSPTLAGRLARTLALNSVASGREAAASESG